MVSHGAPAQNLYGLEVKQNFIDIGYDKFTDWKTLKVTFICADILSDSDAVDELEGKIDIIYASSVFHGFNWDKQLKLATRCVKLLRRKPGSLLIGHHLGHIEPGHYPLGLATDSGPCEAFGHNEASWQNMWDLVGQDTGSEWKCETKMGDLRIPEGFKKDGAYGDEGRRMMMFSVVRE